MCGRVTLLNPSWPELGAWLSLARTPDAPIGTRYNLPPTETLPIIRMGGAGPEGAMARWWFIPEWFRGSLRAWKASTLNARSEEVAGKPVFRDAFRRKRCVIPVSGYFEWQATPSGKQPHYIRPSGNAPALLMAGLWSAVELPDYVGLTCTILTEAARGALAGIHDRMPLMIPATAVTDWLSGAGLAALPRLPLEALSSHEVGRAVNSVRNQGAELIERLDQ